MISLSFVAEPQKNFEATAGRSFLTANPPPYGSGRQQQTAFQFEQIKTFEKFRGREEWLA
jgi:hypothetical protein